MTTIALSLDPIEWVQKYQKIRTECTPRGDLIANRVIMHPWCRREAVYPDGCRPSLGLDAMMPRTTASRPSLNNNLTNRRINNNNNIILLANFQLLIRVFSVISINTYFNINYFYKRPLFFHLDFN